MADEDKINVESHNYRESIQWQDFIQFKENKNIFLLYGSKSKIIIPKRVFGTIAKIDDFRVMLNSKIG